MSDIIQEAIAMLSDMADRLKLDDEEKEQFIESGMTRQGFTKSFTWAVPESDDDKSGGGDFFSRKTSGNNGRQTRSVGSGRNNGSIYGN